ncbi:hypothetical protein AGR7A_Cc120016 [Agrobacterium deltaense NCPPB 1641]|uniref:Uncharacterized protein n=1 Tax=Agrobacterium deltaense NCPPB 1641 TaxID=1183425 RepID=A0A1S7TIS4_9HYPH|nr:hypothetical protein AGR7A_Cc120016 [Agrobacterium deltaense NCPPB 1641]
MIAEVCRSFSVEQAGNRLFLCGAVDRFAEQACGADHADIMRGLDTGGRLDAVGDDEFAQLRGGNTSNRAAGKHAVGDIGGDAGGAFFQQRLSGVAERAAGIDDVVDEDAVLAGDIADDVHDFGFARTVTALVDNGQKTVETLGECTGADHAADIGRNDHDIVGVVMVLHVAGQNGRCEEVVGGDIEEALDLAGMEIEGENAVGAGFGDQIGDELGGNRGAGAGLAVLAGVTEIGKHRGNALGRGAAHGVDHDEQFHQMIICREGGGLDDENVFAAHVLADFYEYFLVSKPLYSGISERNVKILADRFGKVPVRIACENLHCGRLFPCHRLASRGSIHRNQASFKGRNIRLKSLCRIRLVAMRALIALLLPIARGLRAFAMIFVKSL